MYTVSKGPSKIVAKTRRGLHQNYEKFEVIKESGKRSSNSNSPESIHNNPRPTFQPLRKSNNYSHKVEETVISAQHEELINYVSDSWNMVLANNPYDYSQNITNGNSHVTNGAPTLIADSNNNDANAVSAYADIISPPTKAISSKKRLDVVNKANENDNTTAAVSSSADITTPWPVTATVPLSAAFVYNEPASPILNDFTPFDLEAWWGRRLFNNITQGT